MYNEVTKIQFIREYTGSLETRFVAKDVFDIFEPYESNWNKDLASVDINDLRPIIREATIRLKQNGWMAPTIVNEYIKWCAINNQSEVNESLIDRVKGVDTDKIKKRLVSTPENLQTYLDILFDDPKLETVDNIFRGYFWLAYSGLDEEDMYRVSSDDVNLRSLTVTFNGMIYPLYSIAVPTFQKLKYLSDFVYDHRLYTTRRQRSEESMLLRGLAPKTDLLYHRTKISFINTKAIKDGRIDKRLSYSGVRKSGMFYKAYVDEQNGLPAAFVEEANRCIKMEKSDRKAVTESKRKRYQLTLVNEYAAWKHIFGLDR